VGNLHHVTYDIPRRDMLDSVSENVTLASWSRGNSMRGSDDRNTFRHAWHRLFRIASHIPFHSADPARTSSRLRASFQTWYLLRHYLPRSQPAPRTLIRSAKGRKAIQDDTANDTSYWMLAIHDAAPRNGPQDRIPPRDAIHRQCKPLSADLL
jgi:hypothetical protein